MVFPRTDGSRSLIKFAALCALNALVFRATGAAADDTCSLTVSDGDAAVGIQINTDATCSSGGLGCINDICRFCKLRDTFQSSHFFTCDSVGTDSPTTVFPATSSTGSSATADPASSACGISDGDLAVGIRAITDAGCSAGGLGCYSDHCRYCKVEETPQSTAYGDCSSYASSAASGGSSASKTQSSASSAAASPTGSSSTTGAPVGGSAPSSAAASSPQSSTSSAASSTPSSAPSSGTSSAAASSPQSSTSSTASSTTSSAPSDTTDAPTDTPVVASNPQSSPSSAASSTTSSAPSDTTDAPTVASNPQSTASSTVSSTASSAPSDTTASPADNVTSAPIDATSGTTIAPADNADDSTDSGWEDSGSLDESTDSSFGSDDDESTDVADPTTAPVETFAPATGAPLSTTEAPTTTATVVSVADFSWAPVVDTPAPVTETPAVTTTVSAADYTWVPEVTTPSPVETQLAGVTFVQAAARGDESTDAFAKMMKNDTFKWSVTGCAMVGVAAVVGVLAFAVKRVAGRTSSSRGALESESVEQTVAMQAADEAGEFNNTPCEDV